MTLVTHSQFAKSHGATKGARRATGVASCDLAGRRSPRAVLVLSDRSTIDANTQPLLLNVYRGNSVFICSLRGHLESLTKDIQHQITPDETHQVISAGGGLRQRAFGSLEPTLETGWCADSDQALSAASVLSACCTDIEYCVSARISETVLASLLLLALSLCEESHLCSDR